MSSVPAAYRIAVRAARGASPVVARLARPLGRGGAKLARGIEARRGAEEVLAAWGRQARDPARSTVWLHAPSVGEGLVAGAVLRAARERRPGLQAVFTHFSPSAERLGERLDAQVEGYLPWDVSEPVGRALEGVRPDVLTFTRTEVWPVLTAEAVARGIPVALVGAVLPPGAGRARWPARSLLRSTWARLSLVCAVGESDAERLIDLGVPAAVVHVTGDPAVDAASGRAAAADPSAPHLAPFHELPRPTVVAGSTWPADEAVLIPALREVREAVPDVRVIFAPHEPTPDAVGGLLSRLQGLGWKSRPLSAVESRGSPGDAAAVVVDRVGVLADLYSVGWVAYVGGGFGAAGLHSVLEPAAAGVPVAFGPRTERGAGAQALVEAGGARVAEDAAALAVILSEWLRAPDARSDAAERALAYIASHRGAAVRTAELLNHLFPGPSP